MARVGTKIDFGKAKVGKSRQKTHGRGSGTIIVLGNRRQGGITLQHTGNVRGNPRAQFDEFGLPRTSKYAALGPVCRYAVALAIREGFLYQVQSGTTEEQVCYGELRRRGFTPGLGSSTRSFQPQSPVAGSIVDFEVWDRGERCAMRPMNQYWHGHLDKINHDDDLGDRIIAGGWTLHDIWSGDSLSDTGLLLKFDQFWGAV